MKFKELSELIAGKFNELQATGKLFRSNVSGDKLWDLYINSFSKEDDPVFRDPNSTKHTCNLDKNFIRRYGNVVAVDENLNIISMFDLDLNESNPYYKSINAMSKALKQSSIIDLFVETYNELNNNVNYEKVNKTQATYKLGIPVNHKTYTELESSKYGVVEPNKSYQFNHFYADLNTAFVDKTGNSIGSILGTYRSNAEVFLRGMLEIPLDTLLLVKDLINQGSLLDGTTHLHKVEEFIKFKKQFDKIKSSKKNTWTWVNSNTPFAKFKNELIGVLCSELAEGVELNTACQTWNKRVDPANYMKATAPITKRQIEEAKKFVQENGYEESFTRRFATLDDISIEEILHSNVGDGKIKQASVFDSVKPSASTRHKKSEFNKVEEVTIDKFMKEILPNCTSVEALLENSMESNLLALTTANVIDSKKIFKWNNNFSWTYNGNLAGVSQIKSAVKDRGGKVDAKVRVSIHFPDTTDDYDLHCNEPNGNHISFNTRRVTHSSSGCLDLDAQGADGHFPPEKRVENLTYTDITRMTSGKYKLWVNNYSGRGIHTSFNLEVEIDGELEAYTVNTSKSNQVDLGFITVTNDKVTFTPSSHCDLTISESKQKTIWGLDTNQFHKVNLVSLSPNHWGDNNTGNMHYLFMLDGCKTDSELRGFHVENLNSDLLSHRKVMEVLANTTQIKPSDRQLCGLGFNSTIKSELIVKVQGSHKRMLKIKF